MIPRTPNKLRWLPALVLCCCLPALAATIYRTVDENGVVSYSSTRPEGDVQIEELEIVIAPPPHAEETQQRLEAIRETSEQLAEDRIARERLRAEQRALRQPPEPAYSPPAPVYQHHYYPGAHPPYYGYPPAYPRYYAPPMRPHWKHSYPPWVYYPPPPPPPRYPPAHGYYPDTPQRPYSAMPPRH